MSMHGCFPGNADVGVVEREYVFDAVIGQLRKDAQPGCQTAREKQ